MMTLPEYKAWVEGLISAAPAMPLPLLHQRMMDKLRAECAVSTPPHATQNLTKGWVDRADRVPDQQSSSVAGPGYIYDGFGPAQPL